MMAPFVVMIVAIVGAKLDQVDSLETLLGFEEVGCLHGAFRLARSRGAGPDLSRLPSSEALQPLEEGADARNSCPRRE
jgi:hypothetical protein